MKILSAEFVKSSAKVGQCPDGRLPEWAFIGRSNVGKSSLINMLVQRKNLAQTSQTPGKTQLINHFLINGSWYMVDLPGYGYARRSRQSRASYSQLIEEYLVEREQLVNLFILVDARLEPQAIDLSFISFVGEAGIPCSIVLTKCDKLSRNQLARSLAQYKKRLGELWDMLPPLFVTSSETGLGREEILSYIESIHDTTHTC